MIEHGLECKDAYSSVLLDENHSEFILEVEWRRRSSLKEILQQFDRLTTQVCASKTYVTVTMTVVVYNILMGIIEDFINTNKDASQPPRYMPWCTSNT